MRSRRKWSGIKVSSTLYIPLRFRVYADTVVHGDIHTMNQTAAGLPTRDKAKTFIYSFLYGAGDNKIGKIVRGSEREGKKLKRDLKRHLQ